MQSIISPVISTSLYFVVFGAAIGSRMTEIDGVIAQSFLAGFALSPRGRVQTLGWRHKPRLRLRACVNSYARRLRLIRIILGKGERLVAKLITGLLTLICLSLPAASQPLDCRQFHHNEDGSWTPIGQLTVSSSPYGGQIYVGPRVFVSSDLAQRLNRQCLTKKKISRPW